MIRDYGYDQADQLIRATHATDPQATVLQRFAYGYDPAGNRLYEQIDDTVTSWTYERLNRLVSQQAGGLLRVAGSVNEPATVRVQGQPATLDASGVFAGGVQVAPGTTRFTIAATDASGNTATETYDINETGASENFTFDVNGNLTSDGTRSFTWDAEDRLTTVTVGTHTSTFRYDGLNRRAEIMEADGGVTSSDTKFLLCGLALCEARDAGGSVLKRYFGWGVRDSGTAYFYTRDHLGSVGELVDSTNTVRARYGYDPRGRRTNVSGDKDTDVGYTGHYQHDQPDW